MASINVAYRFTQRYRRWTPTVAALLALGALVAGCRQSERAQPAGPAGFVQAAPGPKIDETALAKLKSRIETGEIPNVHSVLVSLGGKTVAEWYFKGADERRGRPLGEVTFGPERLHDIRSVSKSVVALLIGIALDDGAIKALDAPVLDYFPEYKDVQSAERRRIRLLDLLTMQSGLHWDESTYPYTDRRNSETAMDLAADRFHHILSQPIDAAPGTRWMYSGGDVALIAEIIQRATKAPIESFARDKLFAPLGITDFEWLKDNKGIPFAASGLRMLPRDLLKIGLLMMNHGRAGDRQVVPASWVDAAITPHATVNNYGECAMKYGYYWWLRPDCKPSWFAGSGNGGQNLWIMPSLDLIVVTTAGLYNSDKQEFVDQMNRSVIQAVSGQ